MNKKNEETRCVCTRRAFESQGLCNLVARARRQSRFNMPTYSAYNNNNNTDMRRDDNATDYNGDDAAKETHTHSRPAATTKSKIQRRYREKEKKTCGRSVLRIRDATYISFPSPVTVCAALGLLLSGHRGLRSSSSLSSSSAVGLRVYKPFGHTSDIPAAHTNSTTIIMAHMCILHGHTDMFKNILCVCICKLHMLYPLERRLRDPCAHSSRETCARARNNDVDTTIHR